MDTSFAATRIWSAAAFLFVVACQLNDTDSAPLAPEDPGSNLEQSASPAQAGAGAGAQAPARPTSGEGGAGSDGAGDAATALPSGPGFGADGSTTLVLDAAFPGFPTLPALEAGTLPPGNVTPEAGAGGSVDAGLGF